VNPSLLLKAEFFFPVKKIYDPFEFICFLIFLDPEPLK
jgi:hypothetical protein